MVSYKQGFQRYITAISRLITQSMSITVDNMPKHILNTHTYKMHQLLSVIFLAVFIFAGCSSSSTYRPNPRIDTQPHLEINHTYSDYKPTHPSQLDFPAKEQNRLINNNTLRHELARWWQTPYVYGGRSKRGVDCSALIENIYYSLGYDLPRTTKEQKHFGKNVRPNQLLIGDVIFFNNLDRKISHAGIYVGEGYFIHASSSYGVTISRLWHPYYKKRFVVAKRMVW